MHKKSLLFIGTLLLSISFFACKKTATDNCGSQSGGGGGLVSLLVSIDNDKQMGLNSVQQIEADPKTYPILDSVKYPVAYANIYRITNTILNSGNVYYKNDFAWRVRIIKDDSTLNAFCTPGGYIYVYTGIIKYLDNEAQLAGVLGHEIAHADRRHGANQMIKQYGLSSLLSILSGGTPNQLETLAANLLMLKYSRDDESQADEYSVRYLYGTQYDPRGAKYFFEKIVSSGQSGTPAFLSTHPDPGDRVTHINSVWQCLGSQAGQTFDTQYKAFKTSLP